MADEPTRPNPGLGEAAQAAFEPAARDLQSPLGNETKAPDAKPSRQLYRHPWVRRIAIPVLRATARDIAIKHHFTGTPLHLNSFRHKSYWYRGKDRERHTMERCEALLKPGQTVVEVGGHIGYLSAFFADRVGTTGQVHVFEPGDNNLPYLRRNVAPFPQCTIVEKAVGSVPGRAVMYVENLTGQNNSLVADHAIFKENVAAAFDRKVEVTERSVEVIRLDDYAASLGRPIDFIKIDVEGFELPVLQGMPQVLATGPTLVLEVQSDHAAIVDLLHAAGYDLFDDQRRPMSRAQVLAIKVANIFCVPRVRVPAFLAG